MASPGVGGPTGAEPKPIEWLRQRMALLQTATNQRQALAGQKARLVAAFPAEAKLEEQRSSLAQERTAVETAEAAAEKRIAETPQVQTLSQQIQKLQAALQTTTELVARFAHLVERSTQVREKSEILQEQAGKLSQAISDSQGKINTFASIIKGPAKSKREAFTAKEQQFTALEIRYRTMQAQVQRASEEATAESAEIVRLEKEVEAVSAEISRISAIVAPTIPGTRAEAEKAQAKAWVTNTHQQVALHIPRIVGLWSTENEQVAALTKAWKMEELEEVAAGFAETVSVWEKANDQFPQERPFDTQVEVARKNLALVKKGIISHLHKKATEESAALYSVEVDGKLTMRSSATIKVAVEAGNLAVLESESFGALGTSRSLIRKEEVIWQKTIERGERSLAAPEDSQALAAARQIKAAKGRVLQNLDMLIAQREETQAQLAKTQASQLKPQLAEKGEQICGILNKSYPETRQVMLAALVAKNAPERTTWGFLPHRSASGEAVPGTQSNAKISAAQLAAFVEMFEQDADAFEEMVTLVKMTVTRSNSKLNPLLNYREVYVNAAFRIFNVLTLIAGEAAAIPLPPPPPKSPYDQAKEAEAVLEAAEGKDNSAAVARIIGLGHEQRTASETLGQIISFQDLLTALCCLPERVAVWEQALEKYPSNPEIQGKLGRRKAALAKLAPALRHKTSVAAAPILETLNRPENKELKNLIRAYVVYCQEGPDGFRKVAPKYLPGKTTDDVITQPSEDAVPIVAEELYQFIRFCTAEPQITGKMTAMCRIISRAEGSRIRYLKKIPTLFGVLDIAAKIPSRPLKELKEVLMGDLYSKFAPEETEFLALPKTNGKGMKVSSAADFYAYVELYLRDPLACVQAENQLLADLYRSLPHKTKGLGPLKWETDELTDEAIARLDKAARTVMLTRLKIDAALFPNGKPNLSLKEVNDPHNYRRADNSPYIHHHDVFPSFMDAKVGGWNVKAGDIEVVNKGPIDSEGEPSPVFEFMVEAKKLAVKELAQKNGNTTLTTEARLAIAQQLYTIQHVNYSPEQNLPRKKDEDGAKTMAHFWKTGGCCRHRSLVLQLALQEAGVPSFFYLGYVRLADDKKTLEGAHAWVALVTTQPDGTQAVTRFSDPNQKIPQEEITKVEDAGEVIVPHQGASTSYQKITLSTKWATWTYYVDKEGTNYIWRPHLVIDSTHLQREVHGQV